MPNLVATETGEAVPIGTMIRRNREQQGLSRAELARRSSTSVTTLVELEGDEGRSPTYELLGRILFVLGFELAVKER